MAEEDQVEKEQPAQVTEEPPHPPDPGPRTDAPGIREPTEEEAEKAAQEQAEAEDAARKEAEGQPEDASVEAKARNPVLVLKEQFDAEWPTVSERFPGVEPEFGKEEDGYVELLNVQAPAMAYATGCEPPILVLRKPERTQHGWDDHQDNSLPPSDKEDGDIEAKPGRRKQQKVTTH